MSENAHFHPWELGFKQSGLRHITRVLHGSAINAFTTLHAFPPCCCPLAVSRPGQAGDPEASSFRTSTLCEGDPTPSWTAQLRHVRSFPPLGLLRVLRPIPGPWVGNGPAHHRAGLSGGRATGGWFPRSPLDHSVREVPSYIPVASPRLRRRHSPWPPARPLQSGPELTSHLVSPVGGCALQDRPVSTRFEPARRLTGLQ